VLYFGSSKSLTDERNEFLDKNKEILIETMFLLNSTDGEFYEEYKRSIGRYYSKIRKSKANRLYEKDIIKIVNVFHKFLEIKEVVNRKGNPLVDYMYELVMQFHNKYYDELRNAFLSKFQENEEKEMVQEQVFEKTKDLINAGFKYPRNPSLPNRVIMLADFLCEVNNEHIYFTSSTTNRNYVEAHHLIPLEYQNEFENSLDVIGNMVSLCVVCHKKLHHAPFEEKKESLLGLYKLKRNSLKENGIIVTEDEFLKNYHGYVNED
jgi:5-methylcytosine-specific restriction enzyme A